MSKWLMRKLHVQEKLQQLFEIEIEHLSGKEVQERVAI